MVAQGGQWERTKQYHLYNFQAFFGTSFSHAQKLYTPFLKSGRHSHLLSGDGRVLWLDYSKNLDAPLLSHRVPPHLKGKGGDACVNCQSRVPFCHYSFQLFLHFPTVEEVSLLLFIICRSILKRGIFRVEIHFTCGCCWCCQWCC